MYICIDYNVYKTLNPVKDGLAVKDLEKDQI